METVHTLGIGAGIMLFIVFIVVCLPWRMFMQPIGDIDKPQLSYQDGWDDAMYLAEQGADVEEMIKDPLVHTHDDYDRGWRAACAHCLSTLQK